jgi:sarcosine oxidase subunit beta
VSAVDHELDLLVVGGGITGLSLAVHAARRGLKTVLVESGALGGVSTQRSGALVRTHYADPGSAALALAGLEHFERFDELYGGPSGFRATGFAYVPAAGEVADGALAARVAMLRGARVETELLDAGELHAIDPSLDVGDAGVVAYEPRSGFADPMATCATLAGAAVDAGAALRAQTRVASLLVDSGGTVAGVVLKSGATLVAGATVLCAGAWSASLAAAAGVSLPIRPTAVKLAFVRRAVDAHLTVIDAANGTYFRTHPDGTTLVGRRTWTDEPLASPDAALPDVDAEFAADARDRLARRLPSAMGAGVVGGRAGMLDMTPDGLPFVGPSGASGLWLCCGWSGTGFKTGPSVGASLAGWIAGGEPPAELAAFGVDRAASRSADATIRSPH